MYASRETRKKMDEIEDDRPEILATASTFAG